MRKRFQWNKNRCLVPPDKVAVHVAVEECVSVKAVRPKSKRRWGEVTNASSKHRVSIEMDNGAVIKKRRENLEVMCTSELEDEESIGGGHNNIGVGTHIECVRGVHQK